jgi:hypothetical protein
MVERIGANFERMKRRHTDTDALINESNGLTYQKW